MNVLLKERNNSTDLFLFDFDNKSPLKSVTGLENVVGIYSSSDRFISLEFLLFVPFELFLTLKDFT
jgi:hypothetical protein